MKMMFSLLFFFASVSAELCTWELSRLPAEVTIASDGTRGQNYFLSESRVRACHALSSNLMISLRARGLGILKAV